MILVDVHELLAPSDELRVVQRAVEDVVEEGPRAPSNGDVHTDRCVMVSSVFTAVGVGSVSAPSSGRRYPSTGRAREKAHSTSHSKEFL